MARHHGRVEGPNLGSSRAPGPSTLGPDRPDRHHRDMAVIDGRTGLEMLPASECWRLLGEQVVGRIGLVVDGQPEILPVNYLVFEHTVVFRTEGGTKLRSLEDYPAVAFEVDVTDVERRTGWSVLLKGRAEEIHEPVALRRIREQPLRLWASGDKPHWIRVVPFEVSGRRIVR